MQFRGGMTELLRQASRVQRKIEEAKTQFKSETFAVSGANDKVKAVVNGAGEVVSLAIDAEFLKAEDISLVQDAIVGVINAGLAKANESLDAYVQKATGGLKIPGMT